MKDDTINLAGMILDLIEVLRRPFCVYFITENLCYTSFPAWLAPVEQRYYDCSDRGTPLSDVADTLRDAR